MDFESVRFRFLALLFGTKFDLKSCWDGFTALSGAGVLSAIKYVMDSWKNSSDGEKPY